MTTTATIEAPRLDFEVETHPKSVVLSLSLPVRLAEQVDRNSKLSSMNKSSYLVLTLSRPYQSGFPTIRRQVLTQFLLPDGTILKEELEIATGEVLPREHDAGGSVNRSYSVPYGVKAQIDEAAAASGMSRSGYVVALLEMTYPEELPIVRTTMVTQLVSSSGTVMEESKMIA